MQAKGLAIPKQRLQSLARAAQAIPNHGVRSGSVCWFGRLNDSFLFLR
jgi:hypothetical protein